DGSLMGGAASLGAGLGLWFGKTIADEYDFASSQGTFVVYSTIAGLATGYGAAYTFFGNFSESTLKPYAILSTLGGIGGYYVMFDYLKDDAKILSSDTPLSNVSFNVNPL